MVEIEPWGSGDHQLLEGLLGDPAMMEYLGGPETSEKIAERQARYEQLPNCFKIVFEGEDAGWVGFWEREHHGETVYEMGWSVLPAFQGRGIATQATKAGARRGARRRGAPLRPASPVGRQRALERGLPQGRLRAAGGLRRGVSTRHTARSTTGASIFVPRKDLLQSDEGDQLDELGRGVAQGDAAAAAHRRELEARERVHDGRLGAEAADVARHHGCHRQNGPRGERETHR